MYIKSRYIFHANNSQNLLFKQFNKETISHSIRVAEIATIIANKLEISEDMIYDCGIWHDAGKTKILDTISVPGPLTEEKKKEIHKHPKFGVEVIDEIYEGQYIEEVKMASLLHHRRIDGSGYPDTSIENIPIFVQIISIADCFEAMVAKRVYKEKINTGIAKEKIMNNECGKFDETVLKAFMEAFDEITELVNTDIEINAITE